MLRYKNIGTVTKTFYGVKIAPGETKSVPGFINSKSFVRVSGGVSNVPVTAANGISELPKDADKPDGAVPTKPESTEKKPISDAPVDKSDDKKSKSQTSIQSILEPAPAKRGRPAKQETFELVDSTTVTESLLEDKPETESHKDAESK